MHRREAADSEKVDSRRARVPTVTSRRHAGRLLAVAVLAIGVVLLTPGMAGAHARLESTEPGPGEQLDEPPERVVLRFSETVRMADDGIEVYAAGGDRLDTGKPTRLQGEEASFAVELPELDDGGYVVSWRAISGDSHPINGAFTFQVGAGSAADAEALRTELLAGTGGDHTLGAIYGVARFAAFLGLVVLVGGTVFLLGLWPSGIGDRRARRLLAAAWATAVVATFACIGLQGAYGAGLSLGDAVDPSVFGDELGGREGRAWVLRLVLLALAALLGTAFARRRAEGATTIAADAAGLDAGLTDASARAADERVASIGEDAGDEQRPDGSTSVAVAVAETDGPEQVDAAADRRGGDGPLVVSILLGLALLGTVSAAGHASSGDVVPLGLAADVVHLAAVSVWLGGLAMLTLAFIPGRSSEPDPAAPERVLTRFSTVAFVAVVVIVMTGLVQACRQLGSVDALTGTTYGRLLLVKVGLVAGMVAVAAFSRSWVRNRLGASSEGDETAAPPPRPDLRLLRRSVAAEVAIAVVVLAVTASLVQSVPGKDALGKEAFETEVHGSLVLLDANVDPAAVGPVTIDLRVSDHTGKALQPEEITASLTLPERELGPLDVTLEPDGVGHYVATGAQVPFPGLWELDVTVRVTAVDQDLLNVPFTVS